MSGVTQSQAAIKTAREADGLRQAKSRLARSAGVQAGLVVIGLLVILLAIFFLAAHRGWGDSTWKMQSGATVTKAWPSDAEVTALLGAGAVVLLAGAFWGRITTIKLPGNVELDLSPDDEQAAAEEAAKAAPQDPQKAAKLAQNALPALRYMKTARALADGQVTDLPRAQIAAIVAPTEPDLAGSPEAR